MKRIVELQAVDWLEKIFTLMPDWESRPLVHGDENGEIVLIYLLKNSSNGTLDTWFVRHVLKHLITNFNVEERSSSSLSSLSAERANAVHVAAQ